VSGAGCCGSLVSSGKRDRRPSPAIPAVDKRRFAAASLFVDPSGDSVPANFQIFGITAGGQAVVNLDNALIDSTDGVVVNVSAPAGYLMAADVFFVRAQSTAPVDATFALPLSVTAGEDQLTGNVSLPAGATASVTIGNGTPVSISDDFSVALR
jgi:hypothetical protein